MASVCVYSLARDSLVLLCLAGVCVRVCVSVCVPLYFEGNEVDREKTQFALGSGFLNQSLFLFILSLPISDVLICMPQPAMHIFLFGRLRDDYSGGATANTTDSDTNDKYLELMKMLYRVRPLFARAHTHTHTLSLSLSLTHHPMCMLVGMVGRCSCGCH